MDYLEALTEDEPDNAYLRLKAQELPLWDLDGNLQPDKVLQLIAGLGGVGSWALRALANNMTGNQDLHPLTTYLRTRLSEETD